MGETTLRGRTNIGNSIPGRVAWEGIISTWCAVLDEYVIHHNIGKDQRVSDLPYWWNEWANAGFLAGAIWRIGGSVICERSFRKDEAQKYPQRSDLRLTVQTDGLQLDCNLETKFAWIESEKGACDKVNNCLTEAMEQLRAPKPIDRAPNGIAICFAVPYLEGPLVSAINACHNIFDSLAARFSNDQHLLAIYEASRNANIYSDVDGSYFYPGVALIGRPVPFGSGAAYA